MQRWMYQKKVIQVRVSRHLKGQLVPPVNEVTSLDGKGQLGQFAAGTRICKKDCNVCLCDCNQNVCQYNNLQKSYLTVKFAQ